MCVCVCVCVCVRACVRACVHLCVQSRVLLLMCTCENVCIFHPNHCAVNMHIDILEAFFIRIINCHEVTLHTYIQ